jgi:hypothetical protein
VGEFLYGPTGIGLERDIPALADGGLRASLKLEVRAASLNGENFPISLINHLNRVFVR